MFCLLPKFQFFCVCFKERLLGLTKLIVTVADQNTKLILTHSRGSDEQKHLALSLVDMVLVRLLVQ